MSLKGKGFFIWKIIDCEKGDPKAIASVAKRSNFTHVILKIADGAFPYNVNRQTNYDYVGPVVDSLRQQGIEVWGWHYVYGDYPTSEANIAVKRMKEFDLSGYVIDAEMEYKEPGKKNAAAAFMKILRKNLPNTPMALSSYRFPAFHPQLPWKTFLDYCDYNMPQVYWEQNHNADANLRRSVKEFQNLTPFRPVIPTGPTYRAGSWVPTVEDLREFLEVSKELKLDAVNFFSWDECRPAYPDLWKTIQEFDWDQSEKPKDITDLWITSLNNGKPDEVTKLYAENSVHITASRSIQGTKEIQKWYKYLLTELLPNGKFTITSVSGSGNSRTVNWICESDKVKISDGRDTIGLINGKIAYHYSFFNTKH
jgi:hypothetical protein